MSQPGTPTSGSPGGPLTSPDVVPGFIAVHGLTKDFGPVRAVNNLSFTVSPGRVTGFLGPNGAGKTTTLRMLLGLVRPTSGTATISGRPFTALPHPAAHVGAALEASSFHPGRTALNHLRMLAPLVPVPDARCVAVLEQVGLADAADRRVGGFSLGMRQRLALATTLLGDPQVLLLDEPANGLDPEGIAWLRGFLRHLAGQGRTVLVSSHMLLEVQQTVDDLIIINRGQLVYTAPIADLARMAVSTVEVASPNAAGLAALVAHHGWETMPDAGHGAHGITSPVGRGPVGGGPGPDARVTIRDVPAARIGAAAFAAGLELHELATHVVGLEDVFLRLVADHERMLNAAAMTVHPEGGSR